MPFGKFENIDAFLESYKSVKARELSTEVESLPRGAQLDFVRTTQDRDIVEVNATVKQHYPDEKGKGVIHYQLLIMVTSIRLSDPDIKKDIDRCLKSHEPVFVAIRYGDTAGISKPIQSGIEPGSKLDIKGEWIPKDKAYAHGGEKMSVLHFTHKPVGFICTSQKCYQ